MSAAVALCEAAQCRSEARRTLAIRQELRTASHLRVRQRQEYDYHSTGLLRRRQHCTAFLGCVSKTGRPIARDPPTAPSSRQGYCEGRIEASVLLQRSVRLQGLAADARLEMDVR